MGAVVEICWGVNVRNRMKKLVEFSQLNLWGSYEGVELHLEFNPESERIIRFVLFVNHPQYFVYAGHTSEAGMNFRKTKARLQDLHLTAAARLGGAVIQEHFYESVHRPGSYGKLTDQQKMVVQRLEAEAITQLKEAVPERFRRLESSALYEGIKELGNEIPRTINLGNQYSNEVSRRLDVLSLISDSFTEAVNEVFSEQHSFQMDLLPTCHFSDWDISQEWDELPGPLTEWIQAQDGLKVDGKPISCKDELTSAYLFLHCKEDLSGQSLLGILLRVAVAYMCQVSRQRRSSVRDLIIPGVSPHHVMARRCSRCHNRVLDDAFACYAELDPKKYVVFYREDGCGHPKCTLGRADFVPTRPDQAWRRATRQALENITNVEWEDHLLRLSAEEKKGLPRSVRVKCSSCSIETFNDERPRWTFESTPSRHLDDIQDVEETQACWI
ncbi:hypothetical protein DTO021D3_6146 [Paecilomyces variotii]|nr:hypothetical protein DTO032I3_4301 [Paecilomyces variotii]KAJ9277048.1 hypothetical protein DTO021D3_6146 [Paecilomyces variotii]KAJ9339356.1 hypothetical protein DTO027B6_8094 [Paecilomyces variotii]KAJ9393262.1 hypothetical protein DTO032I4_33 [Paecilomyces variotii]